MLLPSMPPLRRRSGSFARTPRFGSWTSGSKTIGHSSEMTKKSGDFAPNQIRAPRPCWSVREGIAKAKRGVRYKGRVSSARRQSAEIIRLQHA